MKTLLKALALAAILALPTIAILRPVPSHAGYCTTTCQTYGNQTYCHQSCY